MRLIASLPNGARLELEDLDERALSAMIEVLGRCNAKYACRNYERTDISTPVIIAPMPAQPLPGSIATASTLAFALVHKYVDGTPLYRLAQAFERAGVPVSRGALGHWVIGSSEKHLVRIYDARSSGSCRRTAAPPRPPRRERRISQDVECDMSWVSISQGGGNSLGGGC
jgi:transposase